MIFQRSHKTLNAGTPLFVMVLFVSPNLLSGEAVFDVRVYGAQADGLTDDTRAIQAAINAASAAGSGTVYFSSSPACYMVSGLTFHSNITYAGQDPNVCIKAISSRAVIVSTPKTSAFANATISSLTFDGNAQSFTGKDCLELRGPTNVVIDQVTTTRCGEDGVYVTGWGTGANPAGQGDGLLITNLISSYNGRNGLSIIAGRNITVRDSLFEHHNIAAPFAGVDLEPNTAAQSIENVTFENCMFRDNTYNGFTVWETRADRPNMNLRLINCKFEGNGRDGAYIAASRHVIGGIYVSGAMAANGSRSGYHGGLNIWNATNITLTNLSVNDAKDAIFVWGSTNVMVANSRLSGVNRDLSTNQSGNVQVHATALAHNTQSGSFTVDAQVAPRILTAVLDPITVGVEYFQTLAADGDPILAWAATAGSLPPGLTLSDTGTIAGTPVAVGDYTFTLRAANALTYDERTFTLTVSDPNSPAQQIIRRRKLLSPPARPAAVRKAKTPSNIGQ